MPVITLERLEEWLEAGDTDRERARHVALERIRTLDPSLCAWVEVLPQPSTGSGPLAGVPFGVKDIIETEGLATEYGSPIYKGRAEPRRPQSCGSCGIREPCCWGKRRPRHLLTGLRLPRAIRGISSIRRAAVPAVLLPRWLPT